MEFEQFLVAQEPVYPQVLRELRAGCKTSHWMWFIFPQLRGLGRSATSSRYALDSVAQAQRYLAHELLGARLRECTRLALQVHLKTANDIFGALDAMKFHSSMTLFSLCSSREPIFADAIDRYFTGELDANTLRLLKDGLDRRSPAADPSGQPG